MKKITFILCFFCVSLGFGQTIVEDFETVYPAVGVAGSPFFHDNGAQLATIDHSTDPESGAARGGVLRLITNNSAQAWQGAGLNLQGDFLDLTDDPGSADEKKVSIWVHSNTATALLAKVTGGPGPDSATDDYHNGLGWQELTFDFQFGKDGTGPANGVYSVIRFYPGWDSQSNGTCLTGNCYPASTNPGDLTMYIDEISFGISPGTTWTGNGDTNTNWYAAANWTNGVPTASLEAIIPNLNNDPVAGGAVTVLGMSIEPGAAVTINGAVTNTGTITVSSGASFIAQTSVSGTVTYERNLISSNWHYISSPVIGQDVDNFVAASNLQSGGTDISFCNFNTTANYWEFYQEGTPPNADVLNPGQGYIVNLEEASGDISFTGSMNVDDVSYPLDIVGNGYNLVGNPYTSYINSTDLLNSNSGSLLTETLWVWNQANGANGNYEIIMSGDPTAFQLAPGQGFFVQSNGVPGGNVLISEAFQSHQATDTFLRTAERTEVYLTLSDGSDTKECKLYYIDGTTTGFDNGYDGPMFRAFLEPLSIYTHLVTNGFGRDFGVQSIPNDYENLVIPIGIDAIAGTELSISASAINLPVGINIYLEDRDAQTFTLLSTNSDFTFTPGTDLDGIGRFYLHTNSGTLGLNENALAYDLQIYITEASKQIIIKGQLSSSITNADLYDLQGKLVLSKTLDPSSNSNIVDISGLSSGLYIIKVEGGNQSKTQKVLIK